MSSNPNVSPNIQAMEAQRRIQNFKLGGVLNVGELIVIGELANLVGYKIRIG